MDDSTVPRDDEIAALKAERAELQRRNRELLREHEELMESFSRIQHEELKVREELLWKTLFLDAVLGSHLNIFFKDTRSRFLLVGRGTAEKLAGPGADPRELIGKSEFDFFAESYAQQVREAEASVMRSQKVTTQEETELYPNGVRRYALTTRGPLFDPTGRLVGTYGLTRDVTDLVNLRRQVEAILKSSREAILLLDPQDRIVLCNPGALQMFGLGQEQVLGQGLELLLGSTLAELADRKVPDEISGAPGDGVMEVLVSRRDGHHFPVELSLNTVWIDGLRFTVVIARDVTDRWETQRRLREMAEQDELTGLISQAAFPRKLSTALQEAAPGRFAVLVADLDRFKPVNDRFGHAVGDRLLSLVGQRLKQSVKSTDLVGRLGGDEFGFGMDLRALEPEVEVEQVLTRRMEEIRQRVATHYQVEDPDDGHVLHIEDLGISLGYALYDRDGSSAAELIRVADERMYAAKTSHQDRG
ncbi:MAG: hypothetical protein Kow001_12680 [Acidobacteriota bacterium]